MWRANVAVRSAAPDSSRCLALPVANDTRHSAPPPCHEWGYRSHYDFGCSTKLSPGLVVTRSSQASSSEHTSTMYAGQIRSLNYHSSSLLPGHHARTKCRERYRPLWMQPQQFFSSAEGRVDTRRKLGFHWRQAWRFAHGRTPLALVLSSRPSPCRGFCGGWRPDRPHCRESLPGIPFIFSMSNERG
ncbi:hypothetical protein VTK56DRAFT_7470 [Thermocarpiscus australiensis]